MLVLWLSPFDRTFFALISLLIPQLSAKLTTSPPRLCCYWEEMGKKQATQLTKLYPFDSSIYPLLLCLPLSSLHCWASHPLWMACITFINIWTMSRVTGATRPSPGASPAQMECSCQEIARNQQQQRARSQPGCSSGRWYHGSAFQGSPCSACLLLW